MYFIVPNKAFITVLFILSLFSGWAQSFLGLNAEVGGSYRYLKSDYPILNSTYNTLETPTFSAGFGLSFTKAFARNWFVQEGINLHNKGYNTQITDDYPGELQGDLTFRDVESAKELTQNFVQLQVPAVINYQLKSSGTWHVFAGTGLAFTKTLHHDVSWLGDETNETKPEFQPHEKIKTGLRLQFGWLNELPNKNWLLFLVKYDQEFNPAFDAPISRYLNSFNFAFYYLFRV